MLYNIKSEFKRTHSQKSHHCRRQLSLYSYILRSHTLFNFHNSSLFLAPCTFSGLSVKINDNESRQLTFEVLN